MTARRSPTPTTPTAPAPRRRSPKGRLLPAVPTVALSPGPSATPPADADADGLLQWAGARAAWLAGEVVRGAITPSVARAAQVALGAFIRSQCARAGLGEMATLRAMLVRAESAARERAAAEIAHRYQSGAGEGYSGLQAIAPGTDPPGGQLATPHANGAVTLPAPARKL